MTYRIGDKCPEHGCEMVFEHKTTPYCRQCQAEVNAGFQLLLSASPAPDGEEVEALRLIRERDRRDTILLASDIHSLGLYAAAHKDRAFLLSLIDKLAD